VLCFPEEIQDLAASIHDWSSGKEEMFPKFNQCVYSCSQGYFEDYDSDFGGTTVIGSGRNHM